MSVNTCNIWNPDKEVKGRWYMTYRVTPRKPWGRQMLLGLSIVCKQPWKDETREICYLGKKNSMSRADTFHILGYILIVVRARRLVRTGCCFLQRSTSLRSQLSWDRSPPGPLFISSLTNAFLIGCGTYALATRLPFLLFTTSRHSAMRTTCP